MRSTCLAYALLVALPGWAALADGVCEKPHETSPAELAAMTASLEAIVRALPAAPDGWTIDSDDDAIPAQFCLDDGAKAWAYSHTRHFTRVTNLEASDHALESANRELQANLAEKQPRIEALQAQQAAL